MVREQGPSRIYAQAQFNLGFFFSEWPRVVKDEVTEAAKWYRKAAEQGVAQRQFNLGDVRDWRRRGEG